MTDAENIHAPLIQPEAPQVPANVTTWQLLKTAVLENLPEADAIKKAIKCLLLLDLFVGLYLGLCVIFQKYNQQACDARPARFTLLYFIFQWSVFYLIRLLSVWSIRSPGSVVFQFSLFIVKDLCAAIWAIFCIVEFTKFSGCAWTISMINIVIIFLYSWTAIMTTLIAFPIMLCISIRELRKDVQKVNEKITHIAEIPSFDFDPGRHTAQKFCSICIDDFRPGVKISWLSCDTRHFFHTECIQYWLYKQTICPLCKQDVQFDQIQKA